MKGGSSGFVLGNVNGAQYGVAAFTGVFGKWYGWASRGDKYRESDKLRWFKFMAVRDAKRLAGKL